MRTKKEYRTASKQVFERFKLKYPEIKINYTMWCNVIYNFNYACRDYMLETGLKVKFPYGFGDFAVTKYKQKRFGKSPDGKDVVALSIDWKKTKLHGKTIYHMNYDTGGYNFRWYWFPRSARFEKHKLFNFKPCRVTSRLITHYVRQESYRNKYLQWKN